MNPHHLPASFARSDFISAFTFAHHLFRPPTAEQFFWLSHEADGPFWQRLHEVFPDLPRRLPIPPDAADFESRYIATFDVGLPAPPVPLIESHYTRHLPAPQVIHENLLFYRRFGLQPSSELRDSPDHLRCQLEFAAYLFQMWEDKTLAKAGDEVMQVRRGLRDFIERHLATWLPQAQAAAAGAQLLFAAPALQLSNELSAVALAYSGQDA